MMEAVTLEQVNENILVLMREVDDIKEILEESSLELTDSVKESIKESRARGHSQFISQEEMEKKFL